MSEVKNPNPMSDLVAMNLADETLRYGKFNPEINKARNFAKMLHRQGKDREEIQDSLKTRFRDQIRG